LGGIGGLYPEPDTAGIIHELTCEQVNKQVRPGNGENFNKQSSCQKIDTMVDDTKRTAAARG
jgi:hypothetical protein